MADVIFEEEQEGVTRTSASGTKSPSLFGVVYKTGLAKSQKGAKYVLVAVIILCILLSIGVLVFGNVLILPTP